MSAERIARSLALQARVTGSPPPLAVGPRALYNDIRNHLLGAADEGLLRTPLAKIPKLLKLSLEPRGAGEYVISGGDKNQNRDKDLAHFERDDGGWFDFAITVSHAPDEPLVLLGYNFEIRFPDLQSPLFVRFDLNPPDHANEDLGIRSHIHPGSDDLQVPAPFMSPLEVLDVVVYGLRVREGRKPRTTRNASV